MSAEVSLGWNNAQLIAGAREAGNIVDRTAARMNSALAGISAGVGFGIFDMAVGGIERAATAIFDATLQADSLQLGMTSLEGSTAAAIARLDQLRQLAKDPGLGFQQVVQGDISLRSVGLSAELATRTLREMGNALAVVGKGKADMDGVLLAITQIVSKGKVSAEEINQIAERVPQIRRVMQEAFGTADTEAIQKMGIPVERFVQEIVAAFEKSVPRAIVGLQGKVDNFTDALWARFADLGNGMSQVFGSIEEGTAVLEDSSSDFEAFGKEMAIAAGGAFSLAKTVKSGVDAVGQWSADIATATLDFLGFERVAQEAGAAMEKNSAAVESSTEAVRNNTESVKLNARALEDAERQAREYEDAWNDIASEQAAAAEQAEKTAKSIESLNRQLDEARDSTLELKMNDLEKLALAEAKLKEINAQIAAVKGQKGNEEVTLKLELERYKVLQQVITLEEQINKESISGADSMSRKIADQERALQLYEMELAIAEAQARGQDRKAEQLERERDIIEQTARLMEDMGLGFDEAFRKAQRFVDAKARAEDRQNGEGSGGRKIYGYSQNQGDVTSQRTRAQEAINRRRADYEDSVGRHFGNFSEMDAAQKDKFGSLFGPAPAETAAAKADTSGITELTQSWSEWGAKTLELFEKAMQ